MTPNEKFLATQCISLVWFYSV